MSDDNQKLFSGSLKDCSMAFTNESHLNWHEKKTDITLNIASANKDSEIADQTPTPTRFIRNCEEVGLFQDLQNVNPSVNPFEEVFKKAVESTNIGTLHVPEPFTDDTLHTPHIFPHVDTQIKYARNEPNHDFTLNNDITSTTPGSSEVIEFNSNYSLSIEGLSNKPEDYVRNKIKDVLINNEKNNVKVPVILAAQKKPDVPLNQNSDLETVINELKQPDNDLKEKIREMNRAAQYRCRARKKLHSAKLQKETESLKIENKRLISENLVLKAEIAHLKQIILKFTKDTPNKSTFLVTPSQSTTRQIKPKPKMPSKPETHLPSAITVSVINVPSSHESTPTTILPTPIGRSPIIVQNPLLHKKLVAKARQLTTNKRD